MPPEPDVEALHAQLCEALAVLEPCAVAAVKRRFLTVASSACADRLWSLEFAFDEDDGRIARFEARFVSRTARRPSDDATHGFLVEMTLPKALPAHVPSGDVERDAGADGTLLARFESALAELGAYRTIENVVLVSVDASLF